MGNPYTPPAPTGYTQQNNGYNNNGGGGNRGRNNNRRNGRGGRGGNNQGGGNLRNNPAHPIKHYDNWFYCASCGFDTPHDSANCTRQRSGHIATLTRDQKIADMNKPPNAQQFPSASHAGHHKRFLPSQAAANGYPQYQRDPGTYNQS
jgi:hypothetical protein